MSRARTLIFQSALIGGALALGLAVRALRHGSSGSARTTDPISETQKSPAPHPNDSARPLSLTTLSPLELRRTQNQIHSPHTPTDERAALLHAMFSGVRNERDAALLFETLLREPEASDENNNHLVSALLLWARYDPAAALDATTRVGYYSVRDDAVDRVLRSWAERDLPAALDYLRKQTGGPVAINGPRVICELLADQDPRAAVTTMLDEGWLNVHDNRKGPAFRALEAWLQKDRNDAWAFVLSRNGKERDALLEHIGRVGATIDSADTWARLTSSETHANERALDATLWSWRDVDPRSALKAAGALPPSDFRNSLLRIFGLNPARVEQIDPHPKTLVNELPEGLPRDAYRRGLTERYADLKNFTDAVQCASQIQDPTLHTDALRQLGPAWCKEDAEAASLWLAAQPPSLGRDLVARALAREIIEENPEAALTWATTMDDTTRRETVIKELMEKWHAADPVAAQTWRERP
jgi:hypothetical protein